VAERANAQARLNRMWADLESLANPPATSGVGEPGEVPTEEIDLTTGRVTTPGVPQLDPGPREGQRETVQAQALLEKADRVRPKVSAEDQTELDRLTERVRAAMTDRRWPDLHAASNDLSDVLFYLEDA
jgi:molecular chaperone DnaK